MGIFEDYQGCDSGISTTPVAHETPLPGGPEPSERSVTPRMPNRVTSGTAALTADNPERRSDEAAGKQSAPEMGNRKSSALDSGSERGGDTFHTISEYEGPFCSCILTGCRVQRACPVFSENCRKHLDWLREHPEASKSDDEVSHDKA